MQIRSNGNIENGEGSQINKAGHISIWWPEISLHGSVRPNWQHVVLNDGYSQVSLACYRWPCVFVRAPTHICVRMCVMVFVIMDLPALREKHFTLGKAICWNRLAPFNLSVITTQGEKGKQKNDIQRKNNGKEGDTWCSTARDSMFSTFHCETDNRRWSKQGRVDAPEHFRFGKASYFSKCP